MPLSRTDESPCAMRQLTLGEFMYHIEQVSEPNKRVVFDFGDVPAGETQLFDCYSEYPEEIAVRHRRPAKDRRMTSAENIVSLCAQAVGCTFIDALGEERTMQRETPLWAANWHQLTRNAVVAVEETPDVVIIRTWRMP